MKQDLRFGRCVRWWGFGLQMVGDAGWSVCIDNIPTFGEGGAMQSSLVSTLSIVIDRRYYSWEDWGRKNVHSTHMHDSQSLNERRTVKTIFWSSNPHYQGLYLDLLGTSAPRSALLCSWDLFRHWCIVIVVSPVQGLLFKLNNVQFHGLWSCGTKSWTQFSGWDGLIALTESPSVNGKCVVIRGEELAAVLTYDDEHKSRF